MDEWSQGARADALSTSTVQRAWLVASRIVASRPWLDVSWLEGYDYPGHLVVHDGSEGPALHFDSDEGPTWEPRLAPDVELDWDDVEDIDALDRLAPIDWAALWGASAPHAEVTGKAAIYTLIAYVLNAHGNDGQWSVRPAKLVHYTDESAAAPDSALSLIDDFTSLKSAVEFYVGQIGSPSWGDGTAWHEPLWLVARDDEPRLVLDEAGQVHLTAGSLSEAIEALEAAVDLGGVEDAWRIDVLDALARVRGSFSSLAALLRRGPAETISAVKPIGGVVQPYARRLLTQSERDEFGWTAPESRARVVVLTGSGISAESGLPTFRDADGLWRNHRIEEVASTEAFARDPALVHEYYDLRRRATRAAEPNDAHHALAELGWRLGPEVVVVTQNVDNLHERAGSQGVLHMHGELMSAWCTACGMRWIWEDDLAGDPPCPDCGRAGMRPDIVWCGEEVYCLGESLAAIDRCEVFVAVGTSGTDHLAASLAVRAKAHGARTLLLNLADQAQSSLFDEVRLGRASLVVPTWVKDVLDEFAGPVV